MEQKQRAVIVGCNINNDKEILNMMEELSNLTDACDIEVVGEMTQKLERVYPSHYIGKGKIEELYVLIHDKEVNMAIFNDELTPSQISNLYAALKCKIIDRTILTFDILTKRAKSKEAQLQVEIAKLQYVLPRVNGLEEFLDHQVFGTGFINRGSCESKFELNRKKIKDRIKGLQSELGSLVVQRRNQRKQRNKSGIPVVVLEGIQM